MATVLVLLLATAACTRLLPKGDSETPGLWASFEEARAAIEGIEPGTTTRADLAAAGLDPYRSPNITILTYSDILLRFPVTAAIPLAELDEGLRACFVAGKECDGYLVQARAVRRRRVGNFWLDSLHFDRPADVKGWSFNALILFVHDVVVYRLYGGQPMTYERERTRNPLGPLQGWGEQAPSLMGW